MKQEIGASADGSEPSNSPGDHSMLGTHPASTRQAEASVTSGDRSIEEVGDDFDAACRVGNREAAIAAAQSALLMVKANADLEDLGTLAQMSERLVSEFGEDELAFKLASQAWKLLDLPPGIGERCWLGMQLASTRLAILAKRGDHDQEIREALGQLDELCYSTRLYDSVIVEALEQLAGRPTIDIDQLYQLVTVVWASFAVLTQLEKQGYRRQMEAMEQLHTVLVKRVRESPAD